MTQTGKCDTCRQRKVKCDEEKPKCGACRKKDRPCTYTYGKASALVIQDPNQLTKHGKARIAPVVHTLGSEDEERVPSSSSPPTYHITTEREAETGKGVFQTLTPISKSRTKQSRKAITLQKRRLEIYIESLKAESFINIHQPSSPEATLAARYLNILGSSPSGKTPISILGTWVESIPARIGTNQILDLAVEFLADSYDVFRDESHSKRKKASATKSKALKELQLLVHDSEGAHYNTILAMKIHYAAEILMGIDTLYHTIHAFGLAEILKSGNIAEIDEEHYWDFLDNTYIDDVSEATLAGRTSVYDNEFYLSMTYPPTLTSKPLSQHQIASMAMMHSLIQIPRLVCLIRHSCQLPEDSRTLASAVALAETLWNLDPYEQVRDIIQESITVVPGSYYPEVADWLPNTLEYDSIQSMNICSRYWMLQIQLCGLIDTLYRHFPMEVAASALPDLETVQQIEMNAAVQISQSLPWSLNISRTVSFVPLRLHTPLQVATGPWHRLIRRLQQQDTNDVSSNSTSSPSHEFGSSKEISDATRMVLWIVEQCNRIHDAWRVSRVDIQQLMAAVDAVAGESIPEWMPVKVRFENEEGEMVMKLDYQVPTPMQRSIQNTGTDGESWSRSTTSTSPFGPQDRTRWDKSFVQELPFRPAIERRSGEVKTITFNNTNKNPCFSPAWTIEDPDEKEDYTPPKAWSWWNARYDAKDSPSSTRS